VGAILFKQALFFILITTPCFADATDPSFESDRGNREPAVLGPARLDPGDEVAPSVESNPDRSLENSKGDSEESDRVPL
jgi:hypothetical protein